MSGSRCHSIGFSQNQLTSDMRNAINVNRNDDSLDDNPKQGPKHSLNQIIIKMSKHFVITKRIFLNKFDSLLDQGRPRSVTLRCSAKSKN